MGSKWMMVREKSDTEVWRRETDGYRLGAYKWPDGSCTWNILRLRDDAFIKVNCAAKTLFGAKLDADVWLSNYLSECQDIIRLEFKSLTPRQQELLDEYNDLHQQLFDLLGQVSLLELGLLQPKAHMAKHAELIEKYFEGLDMDNRGIK